MSIENAEQCGFDAAWNGVDHPSNFAEWLKQPNLLSAWYRGWKQYQEWE